MRATGFSAPPPLRRFTTRYPLQDVIRRFYHELIHGRTRVTVVPAATADLTSMPILLIGVFRSGTTLLRYVIDSHSQICCPPESNFIRASADPLQDRDNRTGLDSMGFDEAHVLAKSREWANYFFAAFAAAKGKSRWTDESPAYVGYLNYIYQLLFTAQYMTVYRYGVYVAHSISQAGWRVPSYVTVLGNPGDNPRVHATPYRVQ